MGKTKAKRNSKTKSNKIASRQILNASHVPNTGIDVGSDG